jgi:hypothetical protein
MTYFQFKISNIFIVIYLLMILRKRWQPGSRQHRRAFGGFERKKTFLKGHHVGENATVRFFFVMILRIFYNIKNRFLTLCLVN